MRIQTDLLSDLRVENPKRRNGTDLGRATWFPYYAGFSTHFALSVLESSGVPKNGCVVDPWNGSGTTTSAASRLGYRSLGYDLNPVMVVVAKARALSKGAGASLTAIATDIVRQTRRAVAPPPVLCDPLLAWFVPSSVAALRTLEGSLQILLVGTRNDQHLNQIDLVVELSALAAFFYTALFRTVRTLLKRFFASNPTWIKRPKDITTRVRPTLDTILKTFDAELSQMILTIDESPIRAVDRESESSIAVASSDSLPLADESADIVLTSPPYCTRIDYAVATMAELAILGYDFEGRLRDLRRKLIGTSTVPKLVPEPSKEWGVTCNRFLKKIAAHPSKASSSYYFKNHVQYFDAIYRSLREIKRTLKPSGACVLVVQDSYYKDVHNDLPQIYVEMASNEELCLACRTDFRLRRTMAGVNPFARGYRLDFSATESVLCLRKATNKSC